jgi:hypothetical protein
MGGLHGNPRRAKATKLVHLRGAILSQVDPHIVFPIPLLGQFEVILYQGTHRVCPNQSEQQYGERKIALLAGNIPSKYLSMVNLNLLWEYSSNPYSTRSL